MTIAKLLILFGIGFIVVGILIWLGLPLGKLPGDIQIKGEKSQVYIPIVTSIILSLVLTILLNIVFWLMRR